MRKRFPNKLKNGVVKFVSASDAELKEIGEDLPDGYIAGWASTPNADLVGDVILPGAFQKSITTRGLVGPQGVKLLIDHDHTKPAGEIMKMEYRDGNLWMEAKLNLNVSYVRDRYELSKSNGGFSFSVGFRMVKGGYEWKEPDNGGYEYLEIKEADLHETSVVVFPCNTDAEMSYIKSDEPFETFETLTEFEKALVASGVVKSRSDALAITLAVKANSELFNRTAPTPEPDQSLVADETLDKLDAFSATLQKLFAK